MYTKEQEEIALREYERLDSVYAVIRQLGYPSKSTLYRWYERRNAGLENRHGHTAEAAIIGWSGWIERMKKAGLTRSMSKKGCSPDNAALAD